MLDSMGLFHFSICIIVICLEGGGIEVSTYILVYVVIVIVCSNAVQHVFIPFTHHCVLMHSY